MEEKTKKKSNINWYTLMTVICVILFLFFILWFFMKGNVTTIGEYPEDITPESLRCVKKNVSYKYFKTDTPTNSEIVVNAIFSDDKLDTISFINRTAYADEEKARIMSDAHEADMNFSFYDAGLESYALDAKYSTDKNVAQMTLYAKSAELNDTSVKYLMLDSLPKDLSGYKRRYMDQNFTCEVVK